VIKNPAVGELVESPTVVAIATVRGIKKSDPAAVTDTSNGTVDVVRAPLLL
jgi:hypothetical protein